MKSTAKKKSEQESAAKPRGRKAMALREASGLAVSQSLSIPHMPMTEERKAAFLQRLAECGNVNQAASLTNGGIHSSRSYRRLQANDPAFARLMADAVEGFAARVNEQVNIAAGLSEKSEMIPLVSAGEIICDPVTGAPIYTKKYSEKILLSLARSTNAALRDTKTIVNQNGAQIDDPSNPTIVLSVADLQRLEFADREQLLAICKTVYSNRVQEWSGPEMKTISPDIEGDWEEVPDNREEVNLGRGAEVESVAPPPAQQESGSAPPPNPESVAAPPPQQESTAAPPPNPESGASPLTHLDDDDFLNGPDLVPPVLNQQEEDSSDDE